MIAIQTVRTLERVVRVARLVARRATIITGALIQYARAAFHVVARVAGIAPLLQVHGTGSSSQRYSVVTPTRRCHTLTIDESKSSVAALALGCVVHGAYATGNAVRADAAILRADCPVQRVSCVTGDTVRLHLGAGALRTKRAVVARALVGYALPALQEVSG